MPPKRRPPPPPTGNGGTHPAVRELKKIEGRFFTKFDDWLDLMLAAFCKDEERYMATMRRYGPQETGKAHPADHFANALGAMHLAMRQDNKAGVLRDHLGEIYEAEGAAEKEMAQFFTPMALCEMMARMTIDETAPENARIADPTCGSGRLLMACIRLRPSGYFFGVDKDPTCAKMAALNMLWRNVNSHIICGNSLSLKAQCGWMTSSTMLGGQIKSFGPDVAQELLEASVRAMEHKPVPVERVEADEPKAEIGKESPPPALRGRRRAQERSRPRPWRARQGLALTASSTEPGLWLP
jgi:hypothetical protein